MVSPCRNSLSSCNPSPLNLIMLQWHVADLDCSSFRVSELQVITAFSQHFITLKISNRSERPLCDHLRWLITSDHLRCSPPSFFPFLSFLGRQDSGKPCATKLTLLEFSCVNYHPRIMLFSLQVKIHSNSIIAAYL